MKIYFINNYISIYFKILILLLFIQINIFLYRKITRKNELFTNKTLKVYTTDWWNNKQRKFITDILHLKYPNYKFNFTDKDPDILIHKRIWK